MDNMEAGRQGSSGSRSHEVSEIDSMSLGCVTVRGMTGSGSDGSTSQPVGPVGSRGRSEGPDGPGGLCEGLSQPRVRKASVIDSMPLLGCDTVRGMTGSGSDGSTSQPVGPVGSRGRSEGPDGPGGLCEGLSQPRVRKASVIDSMPLLGCATVRGMTGSGSEGSTSQPVGPVGSRDRSEGPEGPGGLCEGLSQPRVRKASVIDSMPLLGCDTVRGMTGSGSDGSTSQPVGPVGSRDRSEGPDGPGGLCEGLSQPRVRKASVIDSMPLLGCATVRGMTGSGSEGSTSQSVDPFGSKSPSEGADGSVGQSKLRVRRVSDVIDSLGLGSTSPSPTYLNQRSPMFRYPSSSSQSSSSSQDVTRTTVSSTYEQSRIEITSSSDCYSRDLVEHPLAAEWTPLRHEVASAVRQSDETDAKLHTDEGNNEAPVPDEKLPIVEALMPAEPGDEEYSTGHRRRGVAAIFNNDRFNSEPERSGSAADVRVLRRSLSSLGFEVAEHHNLTRNQIANEIDKLVSADFDDCDCFCMAVLTHGEAPELLHAKDGVYRQSELWTPFTADNCPKLAGKPKIFFIQACRGEGLDRGVRLVSYSNTSQMDASPRWSYVIPSWADFLIAHSSVEGFYSWRNPEDGTWWIQTLCEELETRGATLDLLKILTIVNRRVALEFESFVIRRPDLSGCKEIPSFTSTLMRDVYFRPRLPEVLPQPPS